MSTRKIIIIIIKPAVTDASEALVVLLQEYIKFKKRSKRYLVLFIQGLMFFYSANALELPDRLYSK